MSDFEFELDQPSRCESLTPTRTTSPSSSSSSFPPCFAASPSSPSSSAPSSALSSPFGALSVGAVHPRRGVRRSRAVVEDDDVGSDGSGSEGRESDECDVDVDDVVSSASSRSRTSSPSLSASQAQSCRRRQYGPRRSYDINREGKSQEEVKQELRRMQNRAAAKASREKKRRRTEELERHIAQLDEQRRHCHDALERAKQENAQLKAALSGLRATIKRASRSSSSVDSAPPPFSTQPAFSFAHDAQLSSSALTPLRSSSLDVCQPPTSSAPSCSSSSHIATHQGTIPLSNSSSAPLESNEHDSSIAPSSASARSLSAAGQSTSVDTRAHLVAVTTSSSPSDLHDSAAIDEPSQQWMEEANPINDAMVAVLVAMLALCANAISARPNNHSKPNQRSPLSRPSHLSHPLMTMQSLLATMTAASMCHLSLIWTQLITTATLEPTRTTISCLTLPRPTSWCSPSPALTQPFTLLPMY